MAKAINFLSEPLKEKKKNKRQNTEIKSLEIYITLYTVFIIVQSNKIPKRNR